MNEGRGWLKFQSTPSKYLHFPTYLFNFRTVFFRAVKSGRSAESSAQHRLISEATSSSQVFSIITGLRGCEKASDPLLTASTISEIELGIV